LIWLRWGGARLAPSYCSSSELHRVADEPAQNTASPVNGIGGHASYKTIASTSSIIRQKLGLRTASELARFAIGSRLV
jgi:hypothetical protein